MNFIDVKVTVWNRLKFKEDADMLRVLLVLLERGVNAIIDKDFGFLDSEALFETEQQMEPEQNELASTIEIYQCDELIWQNGEAS